jgi:stringent starvation protein B
VDEIPTKPYLLRALYQWCVDNGYTPHLGVKVDSRSQVPAEHIRNGEITLNISPLAVHKLQMGNESIEFSARFAGVARQISVPVARVFALYARETGGGMSFETEADGASLQGPSVRSESEGGPVAVMPSAASEAAPVPPPGATEPPKAGPGGKPTLRRVK